MRTHRATGLLFAAITATSLALVGCGGGEKDSGIADLTATEILDRASTAAKAAKSVHVKGEGTSEGTTFRMDVRFKSGEGAAGTVGVDDENFELIVIGQDLYLKTDQATWTAMTDSATAALIGNRYVKAPASSPDFAELASFGQYEDFITELLKPEGTMTKGETKEVNGVRAIGLVDDDKENGGTLYIALRGEPYPLRAEPSADSADTGSIEFLDWNKEVTLTAPPADQVLDVAALIGG